MNLPLNTSRPRLVVVSAGLGNVASVVSMANRVGFDAIPMETPADCTQSDRFVLPGVGAYDVGVQRLTETGWFDFLRALPEDTPLLGICLGMQLLGSMSDEGSRKGLDRVSMRFTRFSDPRLRVPHMGWNVVEPRDGVPLFQSEREELRYYFTHSYFADEVDESQVIGWTKYGARFPSAVRHGATVGVQFHPEKSHGFGAALLTEWMKSSC